MEPADYVIALSAAGAGAGIILSHDHHFQAAESQLRAELNVRVLPA
jgi:hypothetical protein